MAALENQYILLKVFTCKDKGVCPLLCELSPHTVLAKSLHDHGKNKLLHHRQLVRVDKQPRAI